MNSFRAITKFIKPFPLAVLTEKLMEAMSLGHSCLNLEKLEKDDELVDLKEFVTLLLSNPSTLYNEWLGDEKSETPLVLSNNKLFIQRFYNYEKSIVQNIYQLIQYENVEKQKDNLLKIKQLLPDSFIQISDKEDWQWVACLTAFLQRFTIITGGPGTGKTTTVTKLIYLLLSENPNAIIRMAAPTGKAASRLKESLQNNSNRFQLESKELNTDILHKIEQIPATTIHTLLGYQPNSIHFKMNESNKLPIDILIVDECSMIDLQLFKKLFDAIDMERTKVVLLGDKNQLASVEMGNVFGNLCESISAKNHFSQMYIHTFSQFHPELHIKNKLEDDVHLLDNHIIELEKSYRFIADKGIGKLSFAVLKQNSEEIENIWNAHHNIEEIFIHDKLDYKKIVDELANEESYFFEINIESALKKINRYKILTAQNDGPFGIHEINRKIEIELQKRGIIKKTTRFYHNQLILVTQNQSNLGIYNGDIGIIREEMIDGIPTLLAYFEDIDADYKSIIPLEIKSCQTAYAMTIHKSQGSEFDHTVIALPENDLEQLLNKELLYTGITRAKNKLSIYGDLDLVISISNRTMNRESGINYLLTKLNPFTK